MRKILFLFFALVSITSTAQNTFSKGDNTLSLGIGIGSPYISVLNFVGSSSLPVNPTLIFEHGFNDVISGGVIASYVTKSSNFGGGDIVKVSATYIGVRADYHFDKIFDLEKTKFDIYAGAGFGYVLINFKESDNGSQFYNASVGNGVGLSLIAGGKYYFSPKVAVYAELGFASISPINGGVSFKL